MAKEKDDIEHRKNHLEGLVENLTSEAKVAERTWMKRMEDEKQQLRLSMAKDFASKWDVEMKKRIDTQTLQLKALEKQHSELLASKEAECTSEKAEKEKAKAAKSK